MSSADVVAQPPFSIPVTASQARWAPGVWGEAPHRDRMVLVCLSVLLLVALAVLGGDTGGGGGGGAGAVGVCDRLLVLCGFVLVAVVARYVNLWRLARTAETHKVFVQEAFAREERERESRRPWEAFVSRAPQTSALRSCPDILVRRGDRFFLYDSQLPKETTALNPLVFRSLSEYLAHWRDSKQRGQHCPVAYLREDASDGPVYFEEQLAEDLRRAEAVERLKDPAQFAFYYPAETQVARSLALEKEDDAAADDEKKKGPAPLDPLGANQMQGVWTARDEQRQQSMLGGYDVSAATAQRRQGEGAGIPGVSANPMDPNWGGAEYTRLVNAGEL